MTRDKLAKLAERYSADGMGASSPSRLVVLMFDRVESDLERATEAIAADDVEASHRALINAQDIVFELQMALDAEIWPGAIELASIYDYLMGLMVHANLTKDAAVVRRCLDVVEPLAESWREAYRLVRQHDTEAAEAALSRA